MGTKKCKNILEICLSPDLGGLELCAFDDFSYLKIRISTYLCVSPQNKLDNYVEDINKFTLKRNKLFPIIPAFKLAKFIDEKKIDIIHFHWMKDITTVILAKLISKRKPKIIQSRHMTMTRFKDDIYHKWLYKNITTIHAVTQQVKEQLIKYIPQDIRPKIEMIYLGVCEPIIEVKKIESLKVKYKIKDSFVVGIIGRIEEGKGQYLLIEALAKLKNLNIKVLIVGASMSHDYLLNLKAMIKKLGVEERVIFSGFTKDVNEHMQLCNITVLATPQETFGLVVIESMINRVPVIATKRGGPLEIIEEGIDGLLFDRTSEDLIIKIKLLYNNKKLQNSLSNKAYQKVKDKFDKEKQMQKMYQMIEKVCNNNV